MCVHTELIGTAASCGCWCFCAHSSFSGGVFFPVSIRLTVFWAGTKHAARDLFCRKCCGCIAIYVALCVCILCYYCLNCIFEVFCTCFTTRYIGCESWFNSLHFCHCTIVVVFCYVILVWWCRCSACVISFMHTLHVNNFKIGLHVIGFKFFYSSQNEETRERELKNNLK